jgi:carbon monoxide dehydrogenase subunit G
MNLEYKFRLPVAIETVWRTLLDIKHVAPCLPGAAIESGEGHEFAGRMRIKLGPIEMTYRGTLRLTERDDVNHSAVLSASGKEIRGGGGATANINLRAVPAGAGSEVTVQTEFNVSGKAAQFGRGIMEEIGAKLMAEFSTRLAKLIAVERPAAPVADPPSGSAASPVSSSPIDTPVSAAAAPQASNPADPQNAPPPLATSENEALDVLMSSV